MRFLEVYSSVVLAGDGFSPSLFKPEKHKDLIGEPDEQSVIVTPIISQHVFPERHFRVFVAPDRIDLGYTQDEVLPDQLYELASRVVDTITKIDVATCKAFGINVNLVIPSEKIGGSAVDYCRRNFLSIQDVGDVLNCDKFLVNMAKLIFDKEGVRFTMDVEPHFASEGKNLHLKINGHQNVVEADSLVQALSRYSQIREYIRGLPQALLGGGK